MLIQICSEHNVLIINTIFTAYIHFCRKPNETEIVTFRDRFVLKGNRIDDFKNIGYARIDHDGCISLINPLLIESSEYNSELDKTTVKTASGMITLDGKFIDNFDEFLSYIKLQ